MKINEFKKLSSVLSKVIHAFSLCFDKIKINDASFSYDGEYYHLAYKCYVEDCGINFLSSTSSGTEVSTVVQIFLLRLISNIESNLIVLRKEDKSDEKNWEAWRIYNHEYSCLSRITSLEMLKDILSGFAK